VELSRQRKILFRQTAGVVRCERERHLVPADVNDRMMPRLLGESGNGMDEFHRGGEIMERIRPRNRRAFLFPIRHGGERGFDFFCAQFFHANSSHSFGLPSRRIAKAECGRPGRSKAGWPASWKCSMDWRKSVAAPGDGRTPD